MGQKALSFSIEGGFVTNLAREWLFDGKFQKAVDLLDSCTQSDGLTEAEHAHLVWKILDGTCDIVGTYPGEDYGIEERPEQGGNLEKAFAQLREKRDILEASLDQRNEQFAYVIEFLQNEFPCTLKAQAEQFQKDYGYPLLGSEALSSGEPEETTLDLHPLLTEFLEVQKSEAPEYGWLEPNGTFHPVPWGEHEKWALDYVEEHYPEEMFAEYYTHIFPNMGKRSIGGGDILTYKLGWLCIDSPAQGRGRPRTIGKPMTKAQKEFLYDYYMKRKRYQEAKELYEE